MPYSDSEQSLLISIHKTLLELVGEFNLVKQSVEHMEKEFGEYKLETIKKVDKLAVRIDKLEKERIADKASWKGPRTLITAGSAITTFFIALWVIVEKLTQAGV